MTEREVVRLRAHAASLAAPAAVLLAVAAPLGWAVGSAEPRLRTGAGVLAAVVVTWWVLRPFVRWWTTTWTLTTHRLSLRWGVLSRHGRDVPLRRVADLSLRRSVLQRLVGSGTVIIEIAGRDGEAQERVVLDDVPQARRVYAELARLTAGRAREEDG